MEHHPIETESNVTTHLLSLLPELWKYILPYLGGTDFLALITSSHQLRDSEGLNKQITTKLLPLVLSVFMSNRHSVSAQIILNMRQLNKATKKAVDDMLEEEFSPQNYWENITKHHLLWNQRVNNLKGICERKGYLTNGDEGINFTQSPFLGRCFDVDFSFDINFSLPGIMHMREHFLHYMRQHGHYVSQLVCRNFRNISSVFSVLPHVPNLKVLKLYTRVRVQDVEEIIRVVHFPLLPKLEFLDVEAFYNNENRGDCSTSKRFNIALVRHYGVQLKSINYSESFFKGWWQHEKWFTQRFQNLERLRVTNVTEGCYAFIVLRKGNLPKLQEIHFHHSLEDPVHEDGFIKDVLDIVNNFAQKLSSVHLFVPVYSREYGKFREGSMLPLTKLIMFTTNLHNVYATWFWAIIELKFPNLELLSFEEERRVDCSWSSKNEEMKALLRTKAFSLLPKLKKIRITYGIRYKHVYSPQRIEISRAGGKWRRLSRNDK